MNDHTSSLALLWIGSVSCQPLQWYQDVPEPANHTELLNAMESFVTVMADMAIISSLPEQEP